ncbi:hypothetical protein K501DRAFT_183871 [Backusella circina FSU 941]|nr:hypothetical protein K501DRAFT_183871 [Backusella circina FSU 941]
MAINEEDEHKIVLLDILEIVVRKVIGDARTAAKSNESEVTSYRKVAMILDLIFNNSNIDLIDGETTCKASKIIAKNHENTYGNTIPLNRGLRRHIDILLSSKNIDLPTNTSNTYMSYISPKEYVFAVKKISDNCVAVYLKPISRPECLFQLPDFLETLDALYS